MATIYFVYNCLFWAYCAKKDIQEIDRHALNLIEVPSNSGALVVNIVLLLECLNWTRGNAVSGNPRTPNQNSCVRMHTQPSSEHSDHP